MTNTQKTETAKSLVLRFLNGTHSRDLKDLCVIDSTVADRVVCHGFPGGNPFDHESYKAFFRVFRRSFDDMDWTVHNLVAEGDHVSARWEIAATHCGEFAGVPATGRRVRFDGMVLYRLADNRIAETWLYINEVSLLTQIGALPLQAV